MLITSIKWVTRNLVINFEMKNSIVIARNVISLQNKKQTKGKKNNKTKGT
jgi:hypothetical protein